MSDPMIDIFNAGFNIIIRLAKNRLLVTTFLSMAFLGGMAITIKAFIDGDILRFGILSVGTMIYFQASVAALNEDPAATCEMNGGSSGAAQ